MSTTITDHIMEIEKNSFEIKAYSAAQNEFWNQYKNGTWEPNTFKIFDKFLNINNAYFDIGAWIGPTVLYGANIAKKVYGFEADKKAFEELNRNIALNETLKDKIDVFNYGVSDKDKQATFYVGEGMTSMSSVIPGKNNESYNYRVDFKSIKSIIEENQINFKTVNFIKIDIEGGEYELIPALIGYLNKINHYPTLYISFHEGGHPKMLVKELKSVYKYLYKEDFVPLYKKNAIPNEIIATNICCTNYPKLLLKLISQILRCFIPLCIQGIKKNSEKLVISIFGVKISHKKTMGKK